MKENLNWQSHIALILNKISKTVELLKTNLVLSRKWLSRLYFSYIHFFINYTNIIWASTSQKKLEKLLTKQRYAVPPIFNVNKETHARPLFQELNFPNIYQINLLPLLIFMQRIKVSTSPTEFYTYLQPINHVYETRFSKHNFKQNFLKIC